MLYNKNTNCILLQKKLCRQLDSKNHVKDSYDMRECESSFGCKPEFEKKKKKQQHFVMLYHYLLEKVACHDTGKYS